MNTHGDAFCPENSVTNTIDQYVDQLMLAFTQEQGFSSTVARNYIFSHLNVVLDAHLAGHSVEGLCQSMVDAYPVPNSLASSISS